MNTLQRVVEESYLGRIFESPETTSRIAKKQSTALQNLYWMLVAFIEKPHCYSLFEIQTLCNYQQTNPALLHKMFQTKSKSPDDSRETLLFHLLCFRRNLFACRVTKFAKKNLLPFKFFFRLSPLVRWRFRYDAKFPFVNFSQTYLFSINKLYFRFTPPKAEPRRER